jgi:sulfatase maturation enzyme AslB (radical SAM superfamily)
MKYYELEPENNTFKTISIQTTYMCQLKCSNCYLGDMLNNPKYPEVDIDKFEDTMKRLKGRCDIRFIGAEPTLNKNLPKLISIARKNGHRPSLLTNGLRLRREPYVKELKESGLNMLGLSMNGGLDDEMYKIFDNGKYAKQKMEALENCFKYNILPHINVIVDPSNIKVLKPLLNYIIEMASKYNRRFSPVTFPVMLRLKSIGQMGNYMKTKTFSLSELGEIASDLFESKDIIPGELDDLIFQPNVNGYLETRSVIYKMNTTNGILLGKLTDWSVDDDGVPDSGSQRRGILTDNYKIAPFFEYYKKELDEIEHEKN